MPLRVDPLVRICSLLVRHFLASYAQTRCAPHTTCRAWERPADLGGMYRLELGPMISSLELSRDPLTGWVTGVEEVGIPPGL